MQHGPSAKGYAREGKTLCISFRGLFFLSRSLSFPIGDQFFHSRRARKPGVEFHPATIVQNLERLAWGVFNRHFQHGSPFPFVWNSAPPDAESLCHLADELLNCSSRLLPRLERVRAHFLPPLAHEKRAEIVSHAFLNTRSDDEEHSLDWQPKDLQRYLGFPFETLLFLPYIIFLLIILRINLLQQILEQIPNFC